MRNPKPAINTFPTLSQELTMFALLAQSILFLCIAIWHKEANYTEECVGSINLHDVTKCNKNEGMSKKKTWITIQSEVCSLLQMVHVFT